MTKWNCLIPKLFYIQNLSCSILTIIDAFAFHQMQLIRIKFATENTYLATNNATKILNSTNHWKIDKSNKTGKDKHVYEPLTNKQISIGTVIVLLEWPQSCYLFYNQWFINKHILFGECRLFLKEGLNFIFVLFIFKMGFVVR